MPKGYSLLMADEIKSANSQLLGVQLGRVCLNKDIPVSDVASFFGVSRMTVYSWFRGKSTVSGKHAEKMKKLVDKLK
jgi:predicted transcriptional regulator